MFVANLSLTDFRSHAAQSWAVADGLVVIAGPNGAGKTNILEALSLLSPGRGLRAAPFADMIRDGGQNGFSIAVQIADSGDKDAAAATTMIGTGVAADRPGRRRVRINGADASANALAEWLGVLWVTPAMDRLFTDAASQRRRFLDRMVLALHPGHAHHATRYDAAMRARNRLLADDGGWDTGWLSALEAQMADHGSAIDAARRAMIDALSPRLAVADDRIFARPLIRLVDGDDRDATPLAPDTLAQALAASRSRDARAGRTLIGPHRQDLAVLHAGKAQAAARCSTGEQKALLLSLILAHGDLVAERRGQRPLLLLDELAAHLDPERRAALFDRLHQCGGQVWMTGTEAALFTHIADRATMIAL
jgi:DNA replication and repair protein RecF